MARVLHIIASPRGERSRSLKLAEAFLEAYREANATDEIETLNVFEEDIPEFDAMAAAGKYRVMYQQDHTSEEARRWQRVAEACEHFKSFDKYIITCPMWNFSIPYRLKLYIDTIVQPTLTFSVDPDKGYMGLVGDKPVQVLSARGGDYSPGSGAEAFDFHIPYLKTILGLIGLTNVSFINAEPMDMAGPEVAARTLEERLAEAREAGARF